MLEEKDYSKQELADALYAGNIVYPLTPLP